MAFDKETRMIRMLTVVVLAAIALCIPTTAVASSVGAVANPQGECFGHQAADFASLSKDNQTGTAVRVQGQAGNRSDLVHFFYSDDCPRNLQ